MDSPRVGGVELGGSKVVCVVGVGPRGPNTETVIPTTTPGETLGRAVAFFADQARHAPLAALGVASFGPLDLAAASPTAGFITATPKPGWSDVDVAGAFAALGVPVTIDTDVNAAAFAEHHWGAGTGCDVVVYITVGTGIGGGAVVHGRRLHGRGHPEMGHMRVPREAGDTFGGACVFHGDCLEGLASGHALRARWGAPAESLPRDHPAWALETRYLALGFLNVVATLSPGRVVAGGGVLRQPGLLSRIRAAVVALQGGYAPAAGGDVDAVIVPPALGERAGVMGAIAMAQDAVTAPR